MTLTMYLNQSILQLPQTQKCWGKGSGWIIDSVIGHNDNILHNSSAGSTLPKELTIQKKVWFIFKILVIMNAVNRVFSDNYIGQIIIQQELKKLQQLTNTLFKGFILNTYNFKSKLETYTKMKKIILSTCFWFWNK